MEDLESFWLGSNNVVNILRRCANSCRLGLSQNFPSVIAIKVRILSSTMFDQFKNVNFLRIGRLNILASLFHKAEVLA